MCSLVSSSPVSQKGQTGLGSAFIFHRREQGFAHPHRIFASSRCASGSGEPPSCKKGTWGYAVDPRHEVTLPADDKKGKGDKWQQSLCDAFEADVLGGGRVAKGRFSCWCPAHCRAFERDGKGRDATLRIADCARGHLTCFEAHTITSSDGEVITFQIDAFKKHCLMNGLDDIGLTLEKAAAIDSFESAAAQARPWV